MPDSVEATNGGWGRLNEDEYKMWIAALVDSAPPLTARQVAEARLIIHAPFDVETVEAGGRLPTLTDAGYGDLHQHAN